MLRRADNAINDALHGQSISQAAGNEQNHSQHGRYARWMEAIKQGLNKEDMLISFPELAHDQDRVDKKNKELGDGEIRSVVDVLFMIHEHRDYRLPYRYG